MTLGYFLRNVPVTGRELVVSAWCKGEEVQVITDENAETGRGLYQKCNGLLRFPVQYVLAVGDTLRIEIEVED